MTLTLKQAVDSIASWVFCDVGAMLDKKQLKAALAIDVATGSPLPTEEECETLVCSEYNSPEQLALTKKYPALDAWLTEQLT